MIFLRLPRISAHGLTRHGVLTLVAAMALSLPVGACVAADGVIDTETGKIKVETLATGLDRPWGLAFLPDGRVLVTERSGQLRLMSRDGALSGPLDGVPEVAARGQGGLLDVAIDPAFAENGLLYLSYAEAGDGGTGTAVARGKFTETGLEDVKVIFRQTPKVSGGRHFGGRLLFAPDGKLFVTLGDRGADERSQELSDHIGTIVRINPDGSVPEDNPFIGQKDAQPEIWSYGHRNVQGADFHPETGKLWQTEFGPGGGDELNIATPGTNYGWPLVSWGNQYGGAKIADPPTRPELADVMRHWTPVISPSGTTFYTADVVPGWTAATIPAWTGNLLISGLSSRGIVRLTLDGETVTGEERIPLGVRIRDVAQAPDGSVYALTDEGNGKVLRLTAEGS